MPRRQKQYHYLYKTTNLINKKFYVGAHSTNDLNDGYLGSGKYLRHSVNKYGRDNFKIEFLEFFENRIDLLNREKNLVNESLLKNPACMNLMIGGKGGLAVNNDGFKAARKKIKELKKNPEWVKKNKECLSKAQRASYDNGDRKLIIPSWIGKKHNKKSKNKIGVTNSKKQAGQLNSQYGTYWITNKIENKKVKNIEKYLDDGWTKGRTIRKKEI